MNMFIVVKKNGSLKEYNTRELNINELYKYAGFKTNANFKKYTTWKLNLNNINYNISLYGKETGKADYENKYEFPPPNDNILLFNNCVLLNTNDDGSIGNLSVSEWKNINNKLNGGFFDVSDEYTDDDEENLENNHIMLSSGYLDDGFVVEDDEY